LIFGGGDLQPFFAEFRYGSCDERLASHADFFEFFVNFFQFLLYLAMG